MEWAEAELLRQAQVRSTKRQSMMVEMVEREKEGGGEGGRKCWPENSRMQHWRGHAL